MFSHGGPHCVIEETLLQGGGRRQQESGHRHTTGNKLQLHGLKPFEGPLKQLHGAWLAWLRVTILEQESYMVHNLPSIKGPLDDG